jgi:CubicO group peptidase (beta-lactamase class C family)
LGVTVAKLPDGDGAAVQRVGWLRRRCAVALVGAIVTLTGCDGSEPVASSSVSPDTRAARSQAALSELVARDDVPGCAAAVAERGVVVWQGVRGLADIDAKTPIGPETRFHIASISKQFIANAILMLDEAGTLSTSDRLSRYIPAMPAWARQVTLLQLMHHMSGVPDYYGELAPEGWMDSSLDRDEVLAQISSAKKLRFKPGTRWEYSNSNYFLLGLVVERTSGQSLDAFLRTRIFEPLQLEMTAEPKPHVTHRAHSYRSAGLDFEEVTFDIYALGPSGVWSTAAVLAVWGDIYRTEKLGGPDLQVRRLEGAPETGIESSRYGAGIFILDSNRLYATGTFDAFNSVFLVSSDRQRSAAVLCNRAESKPYILSDVLALIWAFD